MFYFNVEPRLDTHTKTL